MLEGKERAWVWERLGRLWRALESLVAWIRAGAASPRVVPRWSLDAEWGKWGRGAGTAALPSLALTRSASSALGEMGVAEPGLRRRTEKLLPSIL